MSKKILIFTILAVAIIVCYAIYESSESIVEENNKYCVVDTDCVVFEEPGDCNCGCHSKNHVPSLTGEECLCSAPSSCECVKGICEGIFKGEKITSFIECIEAGYPALESHPRKCLTSDDKMFTEEYCAKKDSSYIMTLEKAKEIAINSECEDMLEEDYICNEITGTYWIELGIEREGCNPACVINIETEEAEINWRCMGLIE